MFVSKPASLSGAALSQSSHVSDLYDQLTDGTREIHLVQAAAKDSISAAVLPNSIIFTLTNSSVSGQLSETYINGTMESNGYSAVNYPWQMWTVYNTGIQSAQLIQSVKYNITSWKWRIVSNEGERWL